MAEPSAGSGMSRAAKKRAKKKQKQLGQQQQDQAKRSIDSVTADDEEEKNVSLPLDKKIRVAEPVKTAIAEGRNPSDAVEDEEIEEDYDEHLSEGENGDDQDEGDSTTEGVYSVENQPMPECAKLLDLLDLEKSSSNEQISDLTSRQRARCALQFLLGPSSVSQFYKEHWEKKPLCVQSDTTEHRRRLDGFLSLASIKSMVDNHDMYYGRDLNVTRYEKGADGVKRRTTLDMVKASRASANVNPSDLENYVQVQGETLWTHYQQGCTVRLLCPHKHSSTTHALLSLLELEWGSMVGANAYLTPPGRSQGFAPHYDDIEAMCLQLQGRKRWKVYAPLTKAERLPRHSSPDYTDDDLADAKPVLDVILEPGDVLYMPRGWIHQACTLPPGQDQDEHSLHLTVSAMQNWAWVDYLDILLPEALEAAANSDSVSLREGLPTGFLDYMGAMHDNRTDNLPEPLTKGVPEEDAKASGGDVERLQEAFRATAKKKIARVVKEAMGMLDAACDQIGKRFLSDRLPPYLTPRESADTSASNEALKVMPNMLCRLTRPSIARLVLEDNKAILYHCCDNTCVYHEHALSPMEFEMDDAPAIEQLLTTVEPHWICVADLFHDTIEDKVGVTQALYDEGILSIRPMDM